MIKNLYLYGIISGDEISANYVQQNVDALTNKDELVIWINSQGGDVSEGVTIYNILSGVENKKTCKIIGEASSIASVISCMRGATVEIADNASMLIHKPWNFLLGGFNEDGLKRINENLVHFKSQILKAYEEKTGKTEEELLSQMDKGTYFTAKSAVEWGFADSEFSPGKKVKIAAYRFAALAKYEFIGNAFPEIVDVIESNNAENIDVNTSKTNNKEDFLTNKEGDMPLTLEEAVRKNEQLEASVFALTTERDKFTTLANDFKAQYDAEKLSSAADKAKMLKQITELNDKVLTQEIDNFMAAEKSKIKPEEIPDLKAKLILLKKNEDSMKLNDTKSLYQHETELISAREPMNLDKRLPVQDAATDIPTGAKFAALDITTKDGQKEASKRIDAYMKDNPTVSYDEAFTHLMTI